MFSLTPGFKSLIASIEVKTWVNSLAKSWVNIWIGIYVKIGINFAKICWFSFCTVFVTIWGNLFLRRLELSDIGVVALLNFLVDTLQNWLLLQAEDELFMNWDDQYTSGGTCWTSPPWWCSSCQCRGPRCTQRSRSLRQGWNFLPHCLLLHLLVDLLHLVLLLLLFPYLAHSLSDPVQLPGNRASGVNYITQSSSNENICPYWFPMLIMVAHMISEIMIIIASTCVSLAVWLPAYLFLTSIFNMLTQLMYNNDNDCLSNMLMYNNNNDNACLSISISISDNIIMIMIACPYPIRSPSPLYVPASSLLPYALQSK